MLLYLTAHSWQHHVAILQFTALASMVCEPTGKLQSRASTISRMTYFMSAPRNFHTDGRRCSDPVVLIVGCLA